MHRKIPRWIIDNLLWDTAGTAREGIWGWLWATRKFLGAAAGAAVLTWWEWVEHHPPEIAVVAVIHFVFVLAAIACAVHIGRWFSRGDKTSIGGQPKDPH
jgi:hypothetical protein